MIKVINIMTGVCVAEYSESQDRLARNMADILNKEVPDNAIEPSMKMYTAVNTTEYDKSGAK